MAQKINPISVRLNLNRSSDSSWFSDYYYGKLLYQDVNFRDYFDLIRPPTGKTFGFRLGRFIIHHFPKRTFIHVFFLDRLSRSRHTGLGAIQSVKLIRRIDDATEIQRNEVKIRPKKRYGYHDRLPSMHEIDQLLRVSGWMASKHSISLSPSGNDALLENDDRETSEKRYAFSRFGSFRQISDVFPQTIFTAVRAPLNHLVMQYFFHPKNQIQFDPIVNIVSELVARSIIEKDTTGEARKKEDSLQKRMRSILLNESICSRREGLTYMAKTEQGSYVEEAPRDSTRFIRLANEAGFARRNRPKISPNIQTAYSVRLLPEEINSGGTETRSAEELLALRTALPSSARALTFSHQNALHWLRKQNLLRLRFQTHREQGMPLPSNCIIKSRESIRQPWSILDFGAPFSSRDAEWRPKALFSRYYYWKKMQFFLSDQTKTNTLIRPVKIASVYQSASLIAQEISWKLEQKKSFRQICRSTFQQIEKCQYVKGIRICCSGRLNGAEIAKTECRKYGETSLHVFSDQIDYAKAQASTPYGILGVKVWVSYF
uniref:Small ribosomal subunit protein uS3m n=1 Tax=Tetraphis pellucida TaxID=37420 RepID=A0A075DBF6_9BRYO|nr:ribosomal protein S3 [Tetraphis pellucida]AHI16033.1 ribosomal protein S3 [Tetraphis pellucida]